MWRCGSVMCARDIPYKAWRYGLKAYCFGCDSARTRSLCRNWACRNAFILTVCPEVQCAAAAAAAAASTTNPAPTTPCCSHYYCRCHYRSEYPFKMRYAGIATCIGTKPGSKRMICLLVMHHCHHQHLEHSSGFRIS